MAYIDQQGLVDRFGSAELIQLTDRTNKPASTINATTVSRHITDAESVVDSYLGKRYQLPLIAPAPPALTKAAADIARYFLHGKSAEQDSPVTAAYRDALKWLQQVAAGTVIIENAGLIPNAAGGGQIKSSAPDRVFTRDRLRDF